MRALPIALVLAVLAAGCVQAPATAPGPEPAPTAVDPVTETSAPTGGGTFRYAIQEPPAIVPPLAEGADAFAVVDAVFDALTTWGPDGQPLPAAATSWQANGDFTVWTFTLRDGATFHDGTPVTAADVKFTWEELVRLGRVRHHLASVNGYDALVAGAASGLEGIEAVSPSELRVTLRHPLATFPSVVAHPALAPVPAHAWQADARGFREQPIGNGPFAMSGDWQHDGFVRVSRFDAWQNGPRAVLDEIVFEITEPDAAYLAFQQGRIDFTALPVGALASAVEQFGEAADGVTGPGVLTGPMPVLYHLGFDVSQAPFDDPQVRRAISMAADRAAIVAENLEGNLQVARSAVPPAVAGARPDTCPACTQDREAARAVFAQRGITQLTLWYSRGGGHERIALQLQEDLDQVGVRLVLQSRDFPRFQEAIASGEAGLFRFGWAADYPTLDEMLYPLFHSTADPLADGSANYGGYADAHVDALLDAARGEGDAAARRQRYQEAEDLALGRDQAIVPLFFYRQRAVVTEGVEGLRLSPMGLVNLHEVRLAA